MRLLQPVQVEVEDGNFDHVGVVVVAGEGLLFEELPLRRRQAVADGLAARQGAFRGVLRQDVVVGGDEEAGGAGGGVADAQSGPRIDQGDDEGDDVARRAELAVGAGRGQAATAGTRTCRP